MASNKAHRVRRADASISSTRSWSVVIGAGIIDDIGSLFDIAPYSAIALVTDTTVEKLYGERVRKALSATGKSVRVFSFQPGESSKCLETAERCYRSLMEGGFDRRSLLCALGGGVVGDLAGYIAATYLRGIDYIQLPTTLLAQVDSSIGGKVGVNFGGKKNIIGCFYQPKAIVADVELLRSLPPEETRNGLAEVIKYGAAMDEELFERLSENLEMLDSAGLTNIVERCVSLKTKIVVADETERTGRRAILNFGHSVGHALEAVKNLEGRHGEAVATGMAAAARISGRLGMLDTDSIARIEGLLRRYGLPVTCTGAEPERVLEAMRFDKKMDRGELRWVLLEGIGRGVVDKRASDKIVMEVLGEVCR